MGPHDVVFGPAEPGPESTAEEVRAAVAQQALDSLRLGWDEAYDIDRTSEGRWTAKRLDALGGELEAEDPDELRKQIYEDYGMRPVQRRRGAP